VAGPHEDNSAHTQRGSDPILARWNHLFQRSWQAFTRGARTIQIRRWPGAINQRSSSDESDPKAVRKRRVKMASHLNESPNPVALNKPDMAITHPRYGPLGNIHPRIRHNKPARPAPPPRSTPDLPQYFRAMSMNHLPSIINPIPCQGVLFERFWKTRIHIAYQRS
jgi:hypothetical protein